MFGRKTLRLIVVLALKKWYDLTAIDASVPSFGIQRNGAMGINNKYISSDLEGT